MSSAMPDDEALASAERVVRDIAAGPQYVSGSPLCVVLREYDRMRAELAEVKAALELEVSRRCLGGTPPGYGRWANEAPPPVPSATDPNAPPAPRWGAR